MRFSSRINREIVPQWADCYIDYPALKSLLRLIRVTSADRLDVERSMFGSQIPTIDNRAPGFQNQLVTINQGMEQYKIIKQANIKANSLFAETMKKSQDLFGKFVEYKFEQIERDYAKALAYLAIIKDDPKKGNHHMLLCFLEDLYLECSNLSFMYDTCIESQRRTLLKHQVYSYGYFPTPPARVANLLDISKVYAMCQKIQELYLRNSQQKIKKSRERIRMLASQRLTTTRDSMVIGIMIGAFIAACIFLSGILVYLGKQVQTDPIFNSDFPVWRGITLFIIYIWMLGINFHEWGKYNISYRNILENNDTKYPKSSSFFKVAGLFSVILIIIFTLYALDLGDLIKLVINPQYLPLFIWIPFILFLINPISIFYFKTRKYISKLLWQCLISWVIPITYPIVFATDQFVSLFVPLQNAAFTVCYYAHFKNFNNRETLQDSYDCRSPARLAIFIFSIVIFVYRIMQCIKCGLQVSPINIPDFFNALKYTVALISTILSYFLQNDQNRIFPAWLAFAIITSIYTFYWDLKYDWILLEKGTQNTLLRDRLVFKKRFYYLLLALNLFLRTSWVLTLSGSVVRNFIGSPEVFILAISFLEILRRCVWNMLSVQAEHIKNCYNLVATSKSFITQGAIIQKQIQSNKHKLGNNSAERLGYQLGQLPVQLVNITEQRQQKLMAIKQNIQQKLSAQKAHNLYIKQTNCQDVELINYLYSDK